MSDLLQMADDLVGRAMRAGASDAEAVVSEGEEFRRWCGWGRWSS